MMLMAFSLVEKQHAALSSMQPQCKLRLRRQCLVCGSRAMPACKQTAYMASDEEARYGVASKQGKTVHRGLPLSSTNSRIICSTSCQGVEGCQAAADGIHCDLSFAKSTSRLSKGACITSTCKASAFSHGVHHQSTCFWPACCVSRLHRSPRSKV